MSETQSLPAAQRAEPRPRLSDPAADLRSKLRDARLSGAAALQTIVEHLVVAAPATGAAIALEDPDGQGFVCQASAGKAPDLGARIQSESGLSGECVRSGNIVRCDDTETDPRVDRVLCRELDLRSVLILPLRDQGHFCGVLELFSNRPRAFGAPQLELVRAAAELAVEIARSSALSSLPNASEANDAPNSDLNAAAPAIIDAGPRSAVAPSAPPPASVSSTTAATPKAPSQKREVKSARLSASLRCDVCGYSNTRGARVCANCDIPLSVVENYVGAPTAEQERDAKAAEFIAERRATQPLTEPALPDSGINDSRKNQRLLLAGGAAVLVLAAASFGIWEFQHHSPAPTAAQAVAPIGGPVEASAAPAEQPAAVNTAVPAVTKEKEKARPPAPEVKKTSTPVAHPIAPDTVVKASATQPDPSVQWVAVSALKPVPQPEPAQLPAPQARLPKLPDTVVIPEKPTEEPTTTAVASISTPEPVSQGITGGRLIKRVAPVYPPIAKVARRKGVIVLSAVVKPNGTLQDIQRLSGDSIFLSAAQDALRQWRYEPYLLNGKPVDVKTTITLTFDMK